MKTIHKRVLLAFTAGVACAALAVTSLSPLIEVTQAEASTRLSTSNTFGSAAQWGDGTGHTCTFGGGATTLGNRNLGLTGYYQNCKRSANKGVCARLWQESYRNAGGVKVGRALVRLVCVPAHTGDTTVITPATTYSGCNPYALYSIEVLLFVGDASVSAFNTGLECR